MLGILGSIVLPFWADRLTWKWYFEEPEYPEQLNNLFFKQWSAGELIANFELYLTIAIPISVVLIAYIIAITEARSRWNRGISV
jgi:hypothetical protein